MHLPQAGDRPLHHLQLQPQSLRWISFLVCRSSPVKPALHLRRDLSLGLSEQNRLGGTDGGGEELQRPDWPCHQKHQRSPQEVDSAAVGQTAGHEATSVCWHCVQYQRP